MNVAEIPFGGGISQIYPPPEGAVDSRVRPDHRDHGPGGADRGGRGVSSAMQREIPNFQPLVGQGAK